MTDDQDQTTSRGRRRLARRRRGRRRRRRRRGGRRRSGAAALPGCIAVLIALAVIVGGVYFVVTQGVDTRQGPVRRRPRGLPRPGPRQGGRSRSSRATPSPRWAATSRPRAWSTSVDAFTDAAAANPDSSQIQFGFYQLQKEMAADDVVDGPGRPGRTRSRTPSRSRRASGRPDRRQPLDKGTDYQAADFEKVLDDPDELGLPDYAEGNPEGYLFPATYAFGPNDDADRRCSPPWSTAGSRPPRTPTSRRRREELGYTPAEMMTIASLVEAEGRGDDMPKIARVIYNRLENPDNGHQRHARRSTPRSTTRSTATSASR